MCAIRVSFTMKQAALSAKPDGIVEVYSEELAFVFDQHKILTIEVSTACVKSFKEVKFHSFHGFHTLHFSRFCICKTFVAPNFSHIQYLYMLKSINTVYM